MASRVYFTLKDGDFTIECPPIDKEELADIDKLWVVFRNTLKRAVLKAHLDPKRKAT